MPPRGARERRALHGADRLAHDEQVAAHDSFAGALGRQVDEVVADDEVAGVEQLVEAADARLGDDAAHAGPVQHAEHLA